MSKKDKAVEDKVLMTADIYFKNKGKPVERGSPTYMDRAEVADMKVGGFAHEATSEERSRYNRRDMNSRKP